MGFGFCFGAFTWTPGREGADTGARRAGGGRRRGCTRPRVTTIRRAISGLVMTAPLAACGLDRPIQELPNESVIGCSLEGVPVEIGAAELSGDFGGIGMETPIAAASKGTLEGQEFTIEVLARGVDGRWGRAAIYMYEEVLYELSPGVPISLYPMAWFVGYASADLSYWESYEWPQPSVVVATRDVEDPTLVHVEFEGVFADDTTMSGRFDLRSTADPMAPECPSERD